jgi:hypothetical protein
MNKFNEIINKIYNQIINKNLYNYNNNLINSWFIKLNKIDVNILTTLSTFIIERIIKLHFPININYEEYMKQFKKNSNQDLKAIILLLLPYINDDKINVYDHIQDLNELLLNKDFNKTDLDIDRNLILTSHFKYTNMGIGLFDSNNELNLIDKDFGKLIYLLCYHNFIALNQTLSITNGKMYVNWINIFPINIVDYKESDIYKKTMPNIANAINLNFFEYNGLYIGEFYNVYRNIYYESIKKIKWLIYIINGEYIIDYLNQKFNFNYISYDDLFYNEKESFNNNLKNTTEYNIWKNILIFFINSFSYKNLIWEKYKVEILPFLMEIEDTQNSNIKSNNKFNNITNEDIKLLLNNVESKYIWMFIKESLISFDSSIYSKYLHNKFNNINLKNIYNIAKALSHDSANNWILLPTKYSSLSIDQQRYFWQKFNNNINNYEWIRLHTNLSLEGNNNNIDNLLYAFQNIKYNLVWEYLIYNGLLTEFKINLIDKKDFKEKLIIDKKYSDSYYFISNKQFKEHNFRINKDDNPALDIDLIKNIKNHLWYTFYAMDWVTQINFFHHYLNHQILYITGATGQGKSTQVPKLFMFALKAFDYKNNGRVICTQPRIGPTNGNANRISEELGVPIEQYSLTFKEKIKSDNYYVQLTHSNDKHIKNNCSFVTLKILTDGTLLTELINNPYMKEEIKQKKDKPKIYSHNNLYDVIIIDEAHEHNTNMDLILSLARNSCYLNNDLKLIIMSATMDDDEPVFRRYYNLIDDNYVYPYRREIYDYFSNELFFYDSKYLDRRFHIAPPGQSTQYTVTEIYEPNGNANDIVKRITQSSNFGDILVFENGTNEILKRVKILNEITPKNIIAIPYLSTLNQKYKVMIEINLENNISKIRTAKNKVHEVWNETYTESTDVPENTYNRCIIVATNVAEASITINNLKFVIDNGYAKVNSYDYLFDMTKLEAEKISEASRKQRKGRVGRTSPGTVYYLYEKGDREKIKPKYKINQENFGYNLIKLLETKNDLLDHSEKYLKNFYSQSENIIYPMQRYQTGYNINTLFDLTCEFYIVHPFENKIKRNILNNIIEYKDDNDIFIKIKNKLPEYKDDNDIFIKIKNKLPEEYFKNLLLNMNNKYFIVKINNNYFKTELFNYVEELNEYLNWNEKTYEDCIIMLTSNAYNSFNEVLMLLTLIKTINNSMKNFINDMKIYNNQDNELEYLFQILQDFKNNFNFLRIFSLNNYKTLYNKYINDSKIIIDKFKIDYKNNKLDPPKNIYTVKIWNKLSKLFNNGDLNNENGFMQFIGDLIENIQINDYKIYEKEINNWSVLRNIKPNILLDFIKYYNRILLEVLTIDKNKDSEFNDMNPLEKISLESSSFKKSLTGKNNNEKIIRPFIHGNPLNIGLRYDTNDKYHKTLSNCPVKIKNNDSKINNNSLIFFNNRSESINPEFKFDVSITNKVEIEWLFNALPYFYKSSNFKDSGDIYDDFCVKLKNKWSLNNMPYESSQNLVILNKFIRMLKNNYLVYE